MPGLPVLRHRRALREATASARWPPVMKAAPPRSRPCRIIPPPSARATVHAQASLLDLYSPDRMEVITHVGTLGTWNRFCAEFSAPCRALTAPRAPPPRHPHGDRDFAHDGQTDGHDQRHLPGSEVVPARPDGPQQRAVGAFRPSANTSPVINFKRRKSFFRLTPISSTVERMSDTPPTTPGPGPPQRPSEPGRGARGLRARRNEPPLRGGSLPTLTGASADHAIQLRHPHIETLARRDRRAVGVPNAAPNAENAAALPKPG